MLPWWAGLRRLARSRGPHQALGRIVYTAVLTSHGTIDFGHMSAEGMFKVMAFGEPLGAKSRMFLQMKRPLLTVFQREISVFLETALLFLCEH